MDLIKRLNDEPIFVNGIDFSPDGVTITYQESRNVTERTYILSSISILADTEERQARCEQIQDFLKDMVEESLTELRLDSYNEDD